MKVEFSESAVADYKALPMKLKQTADKQFAFLLKNLLHPSLRSKKYDASEDIWQARLTKSRRFYFRIIGDIYYIIRIIKHPK